MCTAECNSSRNESSSIFQIPLISYDPVRMNLTLVVTQLFVWPFVFINVLMLFTFYRKQAFRTETRYILFAHTLLLDVMFLLLSDFVVILSYNLVFLPLAFCIPLCMFMDAVTSSTPLTITAMCVERYVAICMPLRHNAISTSSRTFTVILIIWILSYIMPFMDICILVATVPKQYFLEPNLCHYEIMTPEHWHRELRSILYIIDFLFILVTEIFCYLMIVRAARRASVDKKSAGKGLRTISMHMLQLILCTAEIICPYIETIVVELDIHLYLSIRFFNFIVFNVLARAVTPLVYGLRDESFCAALLYHFKCRQNLISSEKKETNM